MTNKVIIALGTNVGNGSTVIRQAKEALGGILSGMVSTESIVTKPINLETRPFTNSLVRGRTECGYDVLREKTKAIEKMLGDTQEKRTLGIITIDIDILKIERKRYHTKDWERPYIKELIKKLRSL